MVLMNKLRLIILSCCLFCAFLACKEEPAVVDTTNMSEEDIYFADYEPSEYKWGYINENGQLAIESKYDNTRDFSEGLAGVNYKGKWGFISTDGKQKIDFKYRSVFPFKEGIARVQDFDKLYGFINKSGEEVIAPKFVEAYDLGDGLIKIKTNTGFNFISIKGDTLLDQDITRVNNFKDGYAVVKDFGKETLLDVNGKLLFDYKYDKVYTPHNERIKVRSEKKYGYVSLKGDNLIPIEYEKLSSFQNGLAAGKKDNKWMLIDIGNQVKHNLDTDIDNVIAMNDNRWMVIKGGKFAIMNNEAKYLTDFEYDALNKFHESVAVYEFDGAYGYLGVDGNKITGASFPLCWDFVGDRARAIFDRGVGFLDKKGKPVIPAIFFEVRDFHDGLSRVQIYR